MPSCLWCERRPSRPRGWYCSDECHAAARRCLARAGYRRRAAPKPPCRACGGPIARPGARLYCSAYCAERGADACHRRYDATAKGKARYARYRARRRERRGRAAA